MTASGIGSEAESATALRTRCARAGCGYVVREWSTRRIGTPEEQPDRRRPVRHTEPGVRAAEVFGHGGRAQPQLPTDLGVGQPLGGEGEDLPLPRGRVRDEPGSRARRSEPRFPREFSIPDRGEGWNRNRRGHPAQVWRDLQERQHLLAHPPNGCQQMRSTRAEQRGLPIGEKPVMARQPNCLHRRPTSTDQCAHLVVDARVARRVEGGAAPLPMAHDVRDPNRVREEFDSLSLAPDDPSAGITG